MVNKTKKNKLTINSKKSKIHRGGGMGMGMGAQVTEGALQAAGLAERCNLAVDYYGKMEQGLYSEQKLMEKVKKLEFIKEEPKLFTTLFTKKLKTFCVTKNSKRYLKFCSNLLNCLKGPSKFFEILNDMFDLDPKAPLIKQMYKTKKSVDSTLTNEKFIENEKNLRVETVAKFLVEVVFSAIIDYEKKHPPEKKVPIHALFLKDKLLELFKKINIEFDLKKITSDELTQIFKDKEIAIIDFYSSRSDESMETQDSIENKDERFPTFIAIVAGLLLSIVVIESELFDAPPGVPGGIS